MAFGISPKYEDNYEFDEIDRSYFIVFAHEAAVRLNWNLSYLNKNGFIAYSGFSFASWSEEISVNIGDEHAQIKSQCNGFQYFDWGKNEANVTDFLLTIYQIKSELSPEILDTKLAEISAHFNENEYTALEKPPSTAKAHIQNIFSVFIPREGYFFTPILLNINILMYIIMVIFGVHFFSPTTDDLLKWGGNYSPVVLSGQTWRLATCIFLHSGIFHLLFNLFALLYIGLLLEPYLGKTRFLTAYLFTGIASSVSSLWWNELTISVGASGAIFGLYGVFMALLTSNVLNKSVKKALWGSIAFFVGYNLMNGMSSENHVDNAAHVGGLLSGLVFGFIFIPSLKKEDDSRLKYATMGIQTLILFAFTFFTIINMPNDYAEYEKRMKLFTEQEQKALTFFSMTDAPPAKLKDEIEYNGLVMWRKNLELINNMKELQLPEKIRERNKKLRDYCELRISSYQLIYRVLNNELDQNSYEFTFRIQKYNNEIMELLNEFK